MGGEFFGFLMEKLLEHNALDVWYTPIFMKKNRPAIKISVLCEEKHEKALTQQILKETTTLGVRSYSAKRQIMDRGFTKVNTPFGEVSYKIATGYGIKKGAPEYEDAKKLANLYNVPLKDIYDEAIKAFHTLLAKDEQDL